MLSSSKEDVLNYVDGGLWQYGLEVKSEDVRSLADLLFKELDSRSKLFFSVLDKVSENRSYKQAILQSYGRATFDELTLLLRCCMLILTLADQNTVFEKTQVLLYILGNIIFLVTSGGNEKSSISFQKSASRECSYSDACCITSVSEDFVASLSILEPSDPYLPFLCSVLEVTCGNFCSNVMCSENVVGIAFGCNTFSFPYEWSIMNKKSLYFTYSCLSYYCFCARFRVGYLRSVLTCLLYVIFANPCRLLCYAW